MAQLMRTNKNLSEIKNTANQLVNQKSENKKVLCSLKQQMSSIRQEMSKLIKIKSEEKIKMLQNKPANAVDLGNKNASSKNNAVSQTVLMQQKIKRLEKQNFILQNKLKNIQSQMGSQINALKNKQKQQAQLNQMLATKIKKLEQQAEVLRKFCKKPQKSKNNNNNQPQVQQQLQPVKSLNSEAYLNPQVKQPTNQKIIVKIYDITKQQRQKLVRIIHILQSKISKLEFINAQSCQLVENLNQDLMKETGRHLKYKYKKYMESIQQIQNI